MTRAEFAERLEFYAGKIREIRGVGRNGPHAFVEDKSEIISAMTTEAREMRAIAATPAVTSKVATISPGARMIGRREVQVVRRARRA